MNDLTGRNWRLMLGDVRARMADVEPGTVQTCITSPPYWGLRAYGTEPQLWGGDPDCSHEWHKGITYNTGNAPSESSTLDNGPKAKVNSAIATTGDTCTLCGCWRGELGSEPTIAMFVDHLLEVFEAVRPVLHESGTLVVNLGDCYAGGGRGEHDRGGSKQGTNKGSKVAPCPKIDLPAGNLCMTPARFAIAMQAAGWILREQVVWAKAFSGDFKRGSTMPESIQSWRWERCRVKVRGKVTLVTRKQHKANGERNPNESRIEGANAQWSPCPGCPKCTPNDGYVLRRGSWRHTQAHEMIYVFAKGRDYYGDGVAVKENAATAGAVGLGGNGSALGAGVTPTGNMNKENAKTYIQSPTRNPRNVLHIGTEAYSAAHFATYPSKLPTHFIKALTPDGGCCPACRTPYARVVESEQAEQATPGRTKTLGWRPTCGCDAGDPIPAVVLDTFAGSGTTIRAAIDLGREGLGVELNADYAELARKRITGTNGQAAIKPLPGQGELF